MTVTRISISNGCLKRGRLRCIIRQMGDTFAGKLSLQYNGSIWSRDDVVAEHTPCGRQRCRLFITCTARDFPALQPRAPGTEYVNAEYQELHPMKKMMLLALFAACITAVLVFNLGNMSWGSFSWLPMVAAAVWFSIAVLCGFRCYRARGGHLKS